MFLGEKAAVGSGFFELKIQKSNFNVLYKNFNYQLIFNFSFWKESL